MNKDPVRKAQHREEMLDRKERYRERVRRGRDLGQPVPDPRDIFRVLYPVSTRVRRMYRGLSRRENMWRTKERMLNSGIPAAEVQKILHEAYPDLVRK